jgi:hypothetical protein
MIFIGPSRELVHFYDNDRNAPYPRTLSCPDFLANSLRSQFRHRPRVSLGGINCRQRRHVEDATYRCGLRQNVNRLT